MTRLLILPAIFVAATFSLWFMISSAPGWQSVENGDMNGSDSEGAGVRIEIPTQFDNFTVVADQFRAYKEDHYVYITTVFICAYLYKQTFAIPGSFLLNIIAGALFGMWTGFFMVCVLTTCGSSLCYLFSELFSREYVLYYFGERLTYLQQKVDDNSHRLLPFLLFARMFPISPSWLLNIVAPFLNIPLPIFAFSAFIGLAPYNFICVQAGYILADLKSWDDVLSTSTMLKLCSFALLPLAYAVFVRQPRQRMGQTCTKENTKLDQKLVVITPNNVVNSAKSALANADSSKSDKKSIPKEVQFADHYGNPITKSAEDSSTNDSTNSAIRICLLGNRESGKSTVLEQIRMMSKTPPSDFELELRKSFIYNNCVNSVLKILDYMKRKNLELTDRENMVHVELVLSQERTHGNPLTEAEYEALSNLWKDETILKLYGRRGEFCLNDSTKYFMDNLPRIYAKDYKPTHNDLVMAYIPTVGVQNVVYTVDGNIIQLFEIGGPKILDRKWSSRFEGLDAIFFTLAISVYDQTMANNQVEFTYSMNLLEQLCKEEKFSEIPLYIFLNEIDVFKEKLQKVPLSTYFPDFKGTSQKDSFRYIKNYVFKRCAKHRKNMSNVEINFTCAIDTKQTAELLRNIFTDIIENRE